MFLWTLTSDANGRWNESVLGGWDQKWANAKAIFEKMKMCWNDHLLRGGGHPALKNKRCYTVAVYTLKISDAIAV